MLRSEVFRLRGNGEYVNSPSLAGTNGRSSDAASFVGDSGPEPPPIALPVLFTKQNRQIKAHLSNRFFDALVEFCLAVTLGFVHKSDCQSGVRACGCAGVLGEGSGEPDGHGRSI